VREFAFVSSSLLLAAASAASVAGGAAKSDPGDESRAYLLDSAAADFRAHAPKALAFRKVYFGQFDGEGTTQYEICGEFQVAKPGGKTEWLHFTTIRTSGYEQYIGGQASRYCSREGMSWDEDDWSAELTKRYKSVRRP
jgi:hypothetical protein